MKHGIVLSILLDWSIKLAVKVDQDGKQIISFWVLHDWYFGVLLTSVLGFIFFKKEISVTTL